MSNLKYVNILKCEPGQVVGKNVFDERGILLIAKNAILSEYLIQRLNSLGLTSMPIIADDIISEERKNMTPGQIILESYEKDIDTYKEVLNDLAAGRDLDYEQVNELSTSIYGKIYHSYLVGDCLNQLKDKDQYTYKHSINVALYSMLIAKWMGLSDEQIMTAIEAGVLHDIGKIKVDSNILNKHGPLQPEEFEHVKQHATFSYQLLKTIPQAKKEIIAGVLMHHERENGRGYPLGITGDKIPLCAKIVAVADVYDALTSERVYKKRITPFDTFKEFEKIGYGHFDVKVMLTFLTNIANYYIGSKVKMNTGEIGEVVFIPPHCISKPVVAIDDTFIDLEKDTFYKIETLL
jgi:putative nucleotidyltransferase with HDIG domain